MRMVEALRWHGIPIVGFTDFNWEYHDGGDGRIGDQNLLAKPFPVGLRSLPIVVALLDCNILRDIPVSSISLSPNNVTKGYSFTIAIACTCEQKVVYHACHSSSF